MRQASAPDGRTLGPVAVGRDGSWWFAPIVGGEPSEALVWVRGGEPEIVPVGASGAMIVHRAVPDPSIRRVALGITDGPDPATGRIAMWDIDRSEQVWSIPAESIADSELWDVGTDGGVVIVDEDGSSADGVAGATHDRNAEAPPVGVHAVASGEYLVFLRDGSGDVIGHDGRAESSLPGTGRALAAVQPNEDRSGVMTVDFDGVVQELDVAGSVVWRTEKFVAGKVNDVEVSADFLLAIASSQGTVTVLGSDDAAGVDGVALVHPEGNVDSVAFSPDGDVLVTGVSERRGSIAFDDTVSFWEIETQARVQTTGGEAEEVAGCSFFNNVVRFAHDGSFVAVTSHDFTVSLLDPISGEVTHTFPPMPTRCSTLRSRRMTSTS